MTEFIGGYSPPRAKPEELRMLEVARLRIQELEEKTAQLETALQSRIVIEQAKGILAERLALEIDDAFDVLRSAARSHRMKIHEVARRVVEDRETPAPIVVAMARSQRLRAAWMREVAEAHRARVEELHLAMYEQLERLRRNSRD
jgi:hypothetical protein